MSVEFTGERVVPDQVNVNLWNEHVARYAFASRLCGHGRVLDAGCGAGYGTAELALTARHVTGIDIADDALGYASEHFTGNNVSWARASVTSLPFAPASFDLVIAFEVIEHLGDWQSLLDEVKRVIVPDGHFVVSTPNRNFYAETRRESGPNPFHTHEFEYEEFREMLLRVFPSVALFVQDHTEGILFRAASLSDNAEVRLDAAEYDPAESNFFVAVCGTTSPPAIPNFIYIPGTANLLKERIEHVDRLRQELGTKNAWLAAAQAEHQQLVTLHRELTAELERSNTWAQDRDTKLKAAGERIIQLQTELESQAAAATDMAAAYEARLSEVNEELVRRTAWAQENEAELRKTVELLDRAENTVKERTNWALELQRERDASEAELAKVRASRWVRVGHAFGVGPEITKG
jgi:SAM-dependent methyltransferase